MLQAPQCSASVAESTQADEQFRSPRAHVSAQAPFEHTSPVAQTWSQSPQCFGSVLGSTHSPLQLVYGARHAVWQTPPSQLASVPPACGQTWPQAPQFSASLSRSRQTLAQGW
jgi:hypothetical protein